ncbi:hypothetical protein FM114_01510 [Luteococcus japonicus LSP_Lj1]|uniref:Uncharacterized protein n=1 Tax=Luteococcus japonicus LSP_Lj1 TaxID=1255658 RepID=A0A1R4IFN9_9ACTN|nr:hypothetical protein FM114_01510 [Luteococcus japonicus LSP_Lj1]
MVGRRGCRWPPHVVTGRQSLPLLVSGRSVGSTDREGDEVGCAAGSRLGGSPELGTQVSIHGAPPPGRRRCSA